MKSRTPRILKEARALFWPWCAVMFAGSLALFPVSWNPVIGLFGFWVGIPLMATLSLGNEFQYGTVPLLLSQPIDRRETWAEKWIVLIVATGSAAVLYWRQVFYEQPGLGYAGIVAAVSILSAMFWTLVSRSTIGGLIFNTFQTLALFFVFQLLHRLSEPGSLLAVIGPPVAGIFAICYGLLISWLGLRKLELFQATGGIAGDDLLMRNPDVMDGTLVRSLRCRRTGALANLIRKELRLLWPVWMLVLLSMVFLVAIAPFRFMNNPDNPGITAGWMGAFLGLLLASVLAGSLSIGEERSLGTHAWHMTLPCSVRTQWLTKLIVSVITS